MKNEPFVTKENVEDFIEEMKAYDSIHLDEIPEYRLFISQIEEFFDKKLGKGEDDEDRKAISKTMIQNYIKDGLIMPPEGKSYSRSHVILLAMIYNLKSILTIKDIKKLLSPVLEIAENEDKATRLESIYNTYFDLKISHLDGFAQLLEYDMYLIQERLKEEDLDGEWQKIPQILLVLTLIGQANTRKMLAERIIELNFKSEGEDEEVR